MGICMPLTNDDQITSTHRGHGHCIAKGAEVSKMFAEFFGKTTGYCRGRGGSMHIADVTTGNLGANGIVGGGIPIAVGAALTAKRLKSDRVVISFFGDGANNEGAFHEALNMASLWKLPVIFVCENNLYGEYTPIARTTPIENLADRADSYSMSKARIDGNDVIAVHATVIEAAERARRGDGPTLIEALTYRQKGHSRSDPAKYRPAGELEHWLGRDPILTHERALREAGVEAAEIERTEDAARASVREALKRALSWPEPEPATRFEDVYA